RYYVCSRATKLGRKTCPAPSVPAAEIEQLVIDRLRVLGKDPALQAAVFTQAQTQDADRLAELEAQRRVLEKDLAHWNAQLRANATTFSGLDGDSGLLGFLAELQERSRAAAQQLVKVKEDTHALRQRRLDEDEVAAALEQFGPVWEELTPREQARLVELLVAKVDYDGQAGKVAITFHPPGIKTLADELTGNEERKERRA